jgi:copper(I)-binding protein
MKIFHVLQHRSVRFASVCAGALVVSAMLAVPAHAHGPEEGKACTTLGSAQSAHSKTFVCTMKAGGLVWSKPLKASRSALTMSDGWAKASKAGSMSAAFGMITNPTAKPVRVVAAMSGFGPMQLHEVVMKDGAMVMQQKKGGFVIPAGGTLELKPGGNHLMFMKLSRPIAAGQKVALTLVSADGAVLKSTVIAKNFAGANEEYDGATMGDM